MNTSGDIHITGGVCITFGATKHDIMRLRINTTGTFKTLFVPSYFGYGEYFLNDVGVDTMFFVQDGFEIFIPTGFFIPTDVVDVYL